VIIDYCDIASPCVCCRSVDDAGRIRCQGNGERRRAHRLPAMELSLFRCSRSRAKTWCAVRTTSEIRDKRVSERQAS